MQRVAVIGSGVSGLTAAYLLKDKFHVTLFERDSRLGGHAHTHQLPIADGTVGVDSGFIVHNERTYPNLLRIFAELGIQTQPTEMSMSIKCEGCGLEYAGGKGITGILAQPWQLLNPRFVRMLIEVPKFHRAARELLASKDSQDPTWGEFLTANKFSKYFIRHFAVPLVSCVWSAGDDDSNEYPAKYLFTFLNNHGMLSIGGSPTWRTVTGGSNTYVQAIANRISDVRVNTGIKSVTRTSNHVSIVTEDNEKHEFDYAVIATHANAALQILTDASDSEKADLASIRYSPNETWLHQDVSILPSAKSARAAWNYRIPSCDAKVESVKVTYWMNKLQRLTCREQFLVTLNPGDAIDPKRVLARMNYEHPIFDHEGVSAAERVRQSGGARVAFAGAHLGWGFHEDGARSGVAAAKKFGAEW